MLVTDVNERENGDIMMNGVFVFIEYLLHIGGNSRD